MSSGSPLSLAADVTGTGPPLVCLHGFGANRFTWRHLVEPLAPRFTVTCLDLKGFGQSPKPRDRAYGLRDHAELVTAYFQAHDLRDVTLVGHSFGGIVALAVTLGLCEEEPGRIRALVLIGTPAYPQPLPWFIRLVRTPGLGPLALRAVPARVQVRRILEAAYHDPRRIPPEAVTAYTRALHRPGTYGGIVRTARHFTPSALDGLLPRYATLRVPTLLLWGRHDRIVPLTMGERLTRALPDAELAVIEHAGHLPQEETPEQVVEVLGGFLDGVLSRAETPPGRHSWVPSAVRA
jgi:pimeloyl-ACP methyl ester carboxylesterase